MSRPIARSWREGEVEVDGKTMCVWRTFIFDRKTDTLLYHCLDTVPCTVEYVTTFKIQGDGIGF